MKTASSAPNFNYGYPSPGPQEPVGSQVMDHVFFLSQGDWKKAREEDQFDYIVIGTGFCGLAFAERTLRNQPNARILMLERGPFFLPEHFQNLPLPFQKTLGGLSETFPWTLSAATIRQDFIKWQHGMVPFFGGRSTLWSAWCPRPTREEMPGWPAAVVEAAFAYFDDAERLLNVVPADKIDQGRTAPPAGYRPIFGTLQADLFALLHQGLGAVESATRVLPAPLAVGVSTLQGVDFDKYSTPGPLLNLVVKQKQLASRKAGALLQIATSCVVTRILEQGGVATALETSRGVVNVGNAKVILAMGTLPPTTLLLNSFPQLKTAGQRFTAHFITSVVARVPRADFAFADRLAELELAAIYLAGVDKQNGQQYHIQLTALSDRNPAANAATALRHMPDVVATASMEQLQSSPDYVVFVCAVLGELNHQNPDSWLRRNDGADPTTNVLLQVRESPSDLHLWDTMDEATFQALEKVLSPLGADRVEYWHGDDQQVGDWRPVRPAQRQIRVPALVHEASTLHLGDDETAPVGLDYRPKGVENVYVTGAALWPTGASWNPTMTMVGLTQHLADELSRQAEREATGVSGTLEQAAPAWVLG